MGDWLKVDRAFERLGPFVSSPARHGLETYSCHRSNMVGGPGPSRVEAVLVLAAKGR